MRFTGPLSFRTIPATLAKLSKAGKASHETAYNPRKVLIFWNSENVPHLQEALHHAAHDVKKQFKIEPVMLSEAVSGFCEHGTSNLLLDRGKPQVELFISKYPQRLYVDKPPKNAADLEMKRGIVSSLVNPSPNTVYILVTGDGDFVPIAVGLKSLSFKVLVLGRQGSVSEAFRRNGVPVITYSPHQMSTATKTVPGKPQAVLRGAELVRP